MQSFLDRATADSAVFLAENLHRDFFRYYLFAALFVIKVVKDLKFSEAIFKRRIRKVVKMSASFKSRIVKRYKTIIERKVKP